MKQVIILLSMIAICLSSKAQEDSTVATQSGVIYVRINIDTQRTIQDISYRVVDASGDTTYVPGTDTVVKINTHVDSVKLSEYVAIQPYRVTGANCKAHFLTVTADYDDLKTFCVLRYHLIDEKGNEIYSSPYRIDGSCYMYYKAQGAQYAYWKILNDDNIGLTAE